MAKVGAEGVVVPSALTATTATDADRRVLVRERVRARTSAHENRPTAADRRYRGGGGDEPSPRQVPKGGLGGL